MQRFRWWCVSILLRSSNTATTTTHAHAWSRSPDIHTHLFCWLLDKEQATHLGLQENIWKPEESSCQNFTDILESGDHIFVYCPIAFHIWELGLLGNSSRRRRATSPMPMDACPTRPELRMDMILVVLWRFWIARNRLTFESCNDSFERGRKSLIQYALAAPYKNAQTFCRKKNSSERGNVWYYQDVDSYIVY